VNGFTQVTTRALFRTQPQSFRVRAVRVKLPFITGRADTAETRDV
jgi:hypothetical protein